MPPFVLRDTTGRELATVDAPEGASRAEILALAKSQRAAEKPATPPPAKPEGPDIVGRAKEFALREPGRFSTPTGRIFRGLGDVMLPGSIPDAAAFAATLPIGGSLITAPLKRAGAAGVAGGAARYAQTGDWRDAAKTGAYQAGSQLLGEVLPGALRFGQNQKVGGRLLDDAAKKTASDKVMHETVSKMESDAYSDAVKVQRGKEAEGIRSARADYKDQKAQRERAFREQEAAKQATFTRETEAATAAQATAKREYNESGAQIIAEGYKQHVPAWQEIPATEAGLVDMISGSGPNRLSARFDQSMKSAVEQGKGKLLEVRLEDAQALGVRLPKVMKGADGRPAALVPADQAAEAVTGFWKKDPGVYRRVVAELDKKGIGDPVARGEYRAGRSLIDFGIKSKMIRPEGNTYHFNPEAARKGFTDQKVEQLRRRNMGHINEGPIAAAVNRPEPQLRLPAEPTPGTPPVTPAFRRPAPLPPVEKPPVRIPPGETKAVGVTARTIPENMTVTGAAIAELPLLINAIANGTYHYPMMAAAGLAGGLAGRMLGGRRVITEAPISPAARFATQVLPATEAQEARNLVEARRR